MQEYRMKSLKTVTCALSLFLSVSAYAVDSNPTSDDLIFQDQAIRMSYQQAQKQKFLDQPWYTALDQAKQFVGGFKVSAKKNYQAAQTYYLTGIQNELTTLENTLKKKDLEFFFQHLDKVATLEQSLKALTQDETLATTDLSDTDLKEIKKAVPDEKRQSAISAQE